VNYLIIIVSILLSAFFSGITIGFLGLKKTELQSKIKAGNKRVVKIYEVRKNGNLLLITLLFGNVLVNSIVSVYLNSMFSGLIAIVLSTALIVLFGEIVPQAIFYRHALKLGYHLVPLVKVFIFIFYPVAWPLSKLLDLILGEEEENIWSKREMKEIIKIHEDSEDSEIDRDEEKILLGALSFSDKRVKEIMTPKNVVFSLEESEKLDENVLNEIKYSGFSRIPVYSEEKDNIVAVLNVKSLINLSTNRKVSDVHLEEKIFEIDEGTKLDVLLNIFIQRKSHIAYVVDEYKTFLGVVTMEDLLEEILKMEIVDETDKHRDMRQYSRSLQEKKKKK